MRQIKLWSLFLLILRFSFFASTQTINIDVPTGLLELLEVEDIVIQDLRSYVDKQRKRLVQLER